MGVSDSAVRLAVINKLGWIRRQQKQFAKQPRQSRRQMVSGETHYYLGRPYRLRVEETGRFPRVVLRNRTTLVLEAGITRTAPEREQVLHDWYRCRLKELVPRLLEKWQPVLGVEVEHWGIRKMKTKWGSCNPDAKRIWLNFELIKKPVQCLEYLVVHELAHLIEKNHGERFIAILDAAMPKWRLFKQELNAAPLKHEDWFY
jgi:predicted metal-dependent hydrolase